MALGEGASHEQVRGVGQQVGDHLWAFGAPIDPAAEAPAGESIGKFLRAIRNDFPHVVVDASVDYSDSALVCFDLSDIICLVTGLDVVGVKHLGKALDTLLHDRAAARAVPRRAEPCRLQGGLGRERCRAGHEDPGRRDDPVEPARADLAEQGPPGRARRALVRGGGGGAAARRHVPRRHARRRGGLDPTAASRKKKKRLFAKS